MVGRSRQNEPSRRGAPAESGSSIADSAFRSTDDFVRGRLPPSKCRVVARRVASCGVVALRPASRLRASLRRSGCAMQRSARIESPRRRRTPHWIAVLTLAIAGCVSVDYVGKSFPPTNQVDVYLSMTDVKRPYTTIGEVRADV